MSQTTRDLYRRIADLEQSVTRQNRSLEARVARGFERSLRTRSQPPTPPQQPIDDRLMQVLQTLQTPTPPPIPQPSADTKRLRLTCWGLTAALLILLAINGYAYVQIHQAIKERTPSQAHLEMMWRGWKEMHHGAD